RFQILRTVCLTTIMKSAKSRKPSRSPALGAFLCLCASALLSGCTVVAVTASAVSVTASAVGLAADAAFGSVKIVGKGVG
ncbi:hypothetical protein MUQ53_10080, partial [Streptococcus suis]